LYRYSVGMKALKLNLKGANPVRLPRRPSTSTFRRRTEGVDDADLYARAREAVAEHEQEAREAKHARARAAAARRLHSRGSASPSGELGRPLSGGGLAGEWGSAEYSVGEGSMHYSGFEGEGAEGWGEDSMYFEGWGGGWGWGEDEDVGYDYALQQAPEVGLYTLNLVYP
jgi:hypothetical protein